MPNLKCIPYLILLLNYSPTHPFLLALLQYNNFSDSFKVGETICSIVKNVLLLFSHSIMSYSVWPHGLQHARLPCPSSSPGACSNSCSLNRWYHPTISSSVIPFSWLQSFPASGSFPLRQFFTSGGQSTGVSASAPVLPMNIQGWFP